MFSSITPLAKKYDPEIYKHMDSLNRSGREINFKSYSYFVPTLSGKRFLGAVELLEVVRYPNGHSLKDMTNLRMIPHSNLDGDGVPAHLPNMFDMHGYVNLAGLELKLDVIMMGLHEMEADAFDFWDLIWDPVPQLDLRSPVSYLSEREVECHLGSHSDAIQVFRLQDNLSVLNFALERRVYISNQMVSVHVLSLSSSYSSVKSNLKNGIVVVWNCRGACRPSFPENLKAIFSVHKPTMLIITEARTSKLNFETVFQSIGLDLGWDILPTDGLNNGTVILWTKEYVEGSITRAGNEQRNRDHGSFKVIPNEEHSIATHST